jgi:hypothetical protein
MLLNSARKEPSKALIGSIGFPAHILCDWWIDPTFIICLVVERGLIVSTI